MRHRFGLLVCAAALAAAPAAAQDAPLVGRSVNRVLLVADGQPVLDETLLALVDTRAGQALDRASVRETIAHFVALGRFEDVVVTAAPDGDGVVVTFDLVPVRVVQRIVFTGDDAVSASRLRRAVTDRYGASPSLARLDEMAALVTGLHREEGFLQARVTPTFDSAAGRQRTVLTFAVDAGPRAVVRRVTVEGNAPDALTAVRRRLAALEGQPYRRARVDERIEAVVADFRKRGYYEARGDHAIAAGTDAVVDVAVSVDGGPHVTVEFTGDAVPPRVRRDLAPIEREGSLDEDLLEDSANRLQGYFRAQGYRDAAVTFERHTRGEELAVVFRVTRGSAYRLDGVEIAGNARVPVTELQPRLTARLGEPLVTTAIDADAAAIAAAYRERGFTAAKVTPLVAGGAAAAGVVSARVVLQVEEGVRTLVGDVTLPGRAAVPEDVLRGLLRTRPGAAFYQPAVASDRDALLRLYLDRGYQEASVEATVHLSADAAAADVRFAISEGPQVVIDHVLIVGNDRTKTATIQRELTLRPGQPLRFADIDESQRRISALGLFRRVRISEIAHVTRERRDILVAVDEAPATTIGYGGGLEGGRVLRPTESGTPVEDFELAPRGFVELSRRNLFGTAQSATFFGRATLRSKASTTAPSESEEPPDGYTFKDYRVLATYRSPRLFATELDALATGFVEQGVRPSFNFARRGMRVGIARRLARGTSLSGRYTFDRTRIFDERYDPVDQPLIDRLYPRVRLSMLSSSLVRDTRDDALAPVRGSLIGIDGSLAAQALGSQVGFVKSFVQGFLYRRLPGRRGVVFAAGARLGLAAGFVSEAPLLDDEGNPVLGPGGEPLTVEVDDIPASERFFAGGDTTVRGYALDRLGTPETIDSNGYPLGGNAVVILNAELRVPVWRDVGAVAFLDAGNVFDRVNDFAVSEIRPTIGFGVRYRSPVGPIRVDVGFKLAPQTLANGQRESSGEVHISLGQAF